MYIPTGPPLFLLHLLGLQNRPRFSPYNCLASHMGPLESLGALRLEQCIPGTHTGAMLCIYPQRALTQIFASYMTRAQAAIFALQLGSLPYGAS